jgi:putative ABC transport system ATP-binding protein
MPIADPPFRLRAVKRIQKRDRGRPLWHGHLSIKPNLDLESRRLRKSGILPVVSRVFDAKTAAAVLRRSGFVPVDTAVLRATAFRVRNLTKVYGTGAGEVRALRGVDLDVQTGETIVLLGPSGSGKSTLLNVLGGLDRPTSGSVLFHDTDLARLSDVELTRYRRQSVGFVFQFFNLMPSLTAGENVELITEIAAHGMPPSDALAAVGLSDRVDHFPAQLSGGQQQRVAVARAIAKRPELLLCDEPTGSLDSASGIQVIEAIVRVAAEIAATTIIVTHNAVVAGIADRVVRFSNGAVSGITVNADKRSPQELAW